MNTKNITHETIIANSIWNEYIICKKNADQYIGQYIYPKLNFLANRKLKQFVHWIICSKSKIIKSQLHQEAQQYFDTYC